MALADGIRWRLEMAGRDIGVRLGLLTYRPVEVVDAVGWNKAYEAGSWGRLADPTEAARYSMLTGYLQLIGGDPDILDVGCGEGLLRTHLADRAFRRYVGVDVSTAAVERAKGLCDERTEFVVAPEPHVGLGSFDVVVCNEMLYFIDSPQTLLNTIRVVLRPGGSLLSSNWRHGGDIALHRMIDRNFDLVDRVELRNEASLRLRWRVSWHLQRS